MQKAIWPFKFFVLLCLVSTASGSLYAGKVGFYNYEKTEQGFHHYKDPAVKEEKEKTEEQGSESKQEQSHNQRQAPKKLSREQLWDMHPDDFSKHREDSMKWSVKTLEVPDVKYYRYLQSLSTKKAGAWASVSGYVAEQNLTSKNSFDKLMPISVAGRDALEQEDSKQMLAFMSKYSNQYAVVYFSDPMCLACKKQAPIIQKFADDNPNWEVNKVNVGEAPYLVERFKVTSTPTLALIKLNDEKHAILGVGVIPLHDLIQRIYRNIRIKEGLINPQQYYLKEQHRGGVLDPLAK